MQWFRNEEGSNSLLKQKAIVCQYQQRCKQGRGKRRLVKSIFQRDSTIQVYINISFVSAAKLAENSVENT